ncbi:MAG: DMT family transporter [Gammaproteobacteria bacterium]
MHSAPTSPVVDSQRGLAMAVMVASAVLISFGGLAMRGMEAALPWQINFYRAIALFGAVSGFICIQCGRRFFAVIGNIGVSGCIGGLLFACASMAFLHSLARTTVANTMFILGAIPFFTALIARIALKETLSRASVLTMAAAAAGLAVMMFEGIDSGSLAGNALALLTALFFAAYAVILRSRRRREMLPVLLVSALCLMLVSALAQAGDLAISRRDMILSFLWGGLLSGVAEWMFIYASRHIAAAEVTLVILLECALAPLWVWLVFTERPSHWALAGGALIILAVMARALAEFPGARAASPPLPPSPPPLPPPP